MAELKHSLACIIVGFWVPGASFNPYQSPRRIPFTGEGTVTRVWAGQELFVLGPELPAKVVACVMAQDCLGLNPGTHFHCSGEDRSPE